MGWRVQRVGFWLTGDRNLAALFILSILFILGSHFSHADTPQPAVSEETKHRISQIESYVRQQSLHGLSLLPQEARTALGWFSGEWHHFGVAQNPDTVSVEDPAGGSGTASSDALSSDGTPVTFGSNFHHKGFLPTHDAMLLGVGVGKNFFDNKLQFTARPFYGQSWRSLQGYWGSEVAMDIAQRPDAMPWGKIAISLIEGNDSLTDHGTGINLHGDVDLTHGFKFTSGMKQNTSTGDSNYVLLRWSLSFN